MGTIQIQNLSFQYDNQLTPIFNHANLQFDASWHLGLIGRNGRGKTTLLRILQNQLEYQGQIITDLKFQYFPQTILDESRQTWQVIQGLTGLADYDQWRMVIEFEKLKLAESMLEQPFNTLSPGQQSKVRMASLFIDEGNFQLIDEPTNHLDVHGRKIVAEYLQAKTGFITISHDRNFLNQVVDHVVSIDRAKISIYKGNYEVWYQEKTARDMFERLENDKLVGEIDRLRQTSAAKADWAGQRERESHDSTSRRKAKKMMQRAKAIEHRTLKQLAEKSQLLKNLDEVEKLEMQYEPCAAKQTLLRVTEVQLERDGQMINEPITLQIKTGQRLVLSGMNGAGKTTLLKAIFGDCDNVTVTGTIWQQPHLKISYLAQNSSDLTGTLVDFAKRRAISYELLVNMLRKLGFERNIFESPIESMSMGQMRKVALAASLVTPANLYIWDEPLNYLDVLTREQIEALIQDFQPTMLIIDHDQLFVQHVATAKVVITNV